MPKPSEEMLGVHNSLQTNRERVYNTEVKERWLETHQDMTAKDYNKFAIGDNFMPWRDKLIRSLETSRDLSRTEEGLMGTCSWVDYHRLDVRVWESFADRESQRAYSGLNRFEDSTLMDNSRVGLYAFDAESISTFHILLAEAKVNAQRNATELGTELATAMTLAGEEVSRTTGDETVWPNSELYDWLKDLKTALKDWNTLLAKDALPDGKALRIQAEECSRILYACYQAHGSLTKSGGKEAVPFVKYQLLATMRAIGEKVAAQYAARTGKASFTAMYELIRDVPNRGPADQAARKARELVTNYGGDLATAWTGELAKLRKGLHRDVVDLLTEEFDKRGLKPSTIPEALANWRSNFKDLDMMKKNGEVLRKSAAEIAFGLRQYKEIVDNVLSRFNLAKERNNYQQTFDGFAQQLHQEILQCVKTLK